MRGVADVRLAVAPATTIATAWQFQSAPKYATSGVVRTVSPGETIRRVAPLMARIGVTRVAEVTGLDRTGIPNFTTVRPREREWAEQEKRIN